MEVVGTTGAIRRAKLQSNRHHQQTITHLFTSRMSFLSPNQQCQNTEGRLHVTGNSGATSSITLLVIAYSVSKTVTGADIVRYPESP